MCQPTNNAFFHLPCCLTSFLSPKICSSSIAVCGSSSYLVFSCYCWCLRFSIFLLDRIFFELERPISRWFPDRNAGFQKVQLAWMASFPQCLPWHCIVLGFNYDFLFRFLFSFKVRFRVSACLFVCLCITAYCFQCLFTYRNWVLWFTSTYLTIVVVDRLLALAWWEHTHCEVFFFSARPKMGIFFSVIS